MMEIGSGDEAGQFQKKGDDSNPISFERNLASTAWLI